MWRNWACRRSSAVAALAFRSMGKNSSVAVPLLDESVRFRMLSRTFLDLHKMGNKEAIEKERARISDELSRGYFADISEIRKNGGKIAMANKTVIPLLEAVKIPDFEVYFPDGRCIKLPVRSDQHVSNASETSIPCALLLCISFRASSQPMAESWTVPFLDSFGASGRVQAYEVSLIDSWLLSLGPVKHTFLKMMQKSVNPQRHIVYSFGDHYSMRKELHILNLLTGYIFLLDRFGRIRWQGFGYATEEELSWLKSCTSILLEERSGGEDSMMVQE